MWWRQLPSNTEHVGVHVDQPTVSEEEWEKAVAQVIWSEDASDKCDTPPPTVQSAHRVPGIGRNPIGLTAGQEEPVGQRKRPVPAVHEATAHVTTRAASAKAARDAATVPAKPTSGATSAAGENTASLRATDTEPVCWQRGLATPPLVPAGGSMSQSAEGCSKLVQKCTTKQELVGLITAAINRLCDWPDTIHDERGVCRVASCNTNRQSASHMVGQQGAQRETAPPEELHVPSVAVASPQLAASAPALPWAYLGMQWMLQHLQEAVEAPEEAVVESEMSREWRDVPHIQLIPTSSPPLQVMAVGRVPRIRVAAEVKGQAQPQEQQLSPHMQQPQQRCGVVALPVVQQQQLLAQPAAHVSGAAEQHTVQLPQPPPIGGLAGGAQPAVQPPPRTIYKEYRQQHKLAGLRSAGARHPQQQQQRCMGGQRQLQHGVQQRPAAGVQRRQERRALRPSRHKAPWMDN